MKRHYELSSASSYFYMPGEKICIYADIRLSEKVEAEHLREAAALLLERFPYFAVRQEVSEEGDRYVLVSNEMPFPINEKNGYIEPGSGEANGYLFTLSYYENHIFSEVFHGLSDGGGYLTVLRALLRAYFERKEGRIFEHANAKSVRDQPCEEEWKDPMDCLQGMNTEFRLRKQESFEFPDDRIDNDHVRLFSFSVPEMALVDYAKRNEGGVSGAIALTLARAIDCIEIDNELPLRISCPMDVRKMLNCSETLRNCTKSTVYTHSARLRFMPYGTQLSLLKGQMMIQSSKEYQLPRCEQDRQELRQLNALPSIEEKRRFFSEARLKKMPIVSYLGRFDMGELNDRIERVAVYGKIGGRAGMQNVCLCFRGRCHIYSSYNLKSESYIRMFANEMRDFSSDCSEIVRFGYDNPMVERRI